METDEVSKSSVPVKGGDKPGGLTEQELAGAGRRLDFEGARLDVTPFVGCLRREVRDKAMEEIAA